MKRSLPWNFKTLIHVNRLLLIGIGIFLFGVYICINGIRASDVYYEYLLNGETATTDGVVVDVWEKEWDDLGRAISRGYDFYFIHPTLGEMKNTSYGHSLYTIYKSGDSSTVVYNQEIPYANRLEKADYSEKSYNVLWYLLAPGIGLLIMIVSTYHSAHKIKTLERGMFTWGTLIRTERGPMDSEERPSYVLIYQYKDDQNQKYEGRYKTNSPGDFDKKELIVYNSKTPDRILVLYDLSKSITEYIDDNWEEVKKLH
jgi:hypothetical protein